MHPSGKYGPDLKDFLIIGGIVVTTGICIGAMITAFVMTVLK